MPSMPTVAILVLAACGAPALAAAAPASPPPAPAARSLRPLLVTVDDLPIASSELHPDAADRAAVAGELVRVLARHHVRAIGFVVQNRIRPGDDALLERWLAGGHELGNHTATHQHLTGASAEAWIADADAGRQALAAFLAKHGRAPRFFRYPFLEEGDTPARRDAVRAWLARTGQRAVEVTIDTQDWSFERPWVEARRRGDGAALAEIAADYQAAMRIEVRSQEERGDELLGRAAPQILLLHANEVGAAQWDALFGWLERTGHRFAAPDEVLADPAFARPPEYVGEYGFGLWDRERATARAEQAKNEAAALLAAQAKAWSASDLEAFCAAYAEDASFVSPSGLVRGRAEVLARYRKKYPDAAAMGRLELEPLETRALGGEVFTDLQDARPARVMSLVVVMRWTLSYPGKPSATGTSQVVMRRRGTSWEIVSDASM